MSVYVTSDLHFSHNKEFLYGPRGFSSVEDMNTKIIDNWNSVVTDEDDVFVLGDLMLSDNVSGMNCLSQLKGNIHVIRGNHDTNNRIELYKSLDNIVEICEGKYYKYRKYSFYFCHYPCLTSNYDEDKPLKAKTINLCGHTHTEDRFLDFDKGIIYHVEVDAHNMYPINIENVIQDIQNKLYI